MKKRTFDEMVSYFNRKVADMEIDRKYKMELLGMITAILQEHDSTIKPEQRWIPCSERLPETIHEGHGDTFTFWDSDWVLAQTASGEVVLAQYTYDPDDPRVTNYWYATGAMTDGDENTSVVAWMPLPEPYKERWEE